MSRLIITVSIFFVLFFCGYSLRAQDTTLRFHALVNKRWRLYSSQDFNVSKGLNEIKFVPPTEGFFDYLVKEQAFGNRIDIFREDYSFEGIVADTIISRAKFQLINDTIKYTWLIDPIKYDQFYILYLTSDTLITSWENGCSIIVEIYLTDRKDFYPVENPDKQIYFPYVKAFYQNRYKFINNW